MIVLMPHCGFLSETSRLLALAQALRARGAEVVIASHGGPFENLLGEAGTHWVRLTRDEDGLATQARFIRGITSWGATDVPLYEDDQLRRYVQAETAFLRDARADLVHIGFTLSAYLSSRAVGIPLSTSHVGSFVEPILAAGLAPVPVNPSRADLARLPVGLQRRAVNLVPRLLARPAAQINAHASELGLPHVAGLMGLMSGDLVLVTELPEVLGLRREDVEDWHAGWASRRRRHARHRLTGPLFAHLDIPIPDHVEDFLSRHDDVVYVSPSSVTSDAVRRIVTSAQATGSPVLVAATLHDLHDLADARTCVAGVLPNHLVMPRVAAAVIMGGQGTVQTALAAGTPLVGLPLHPEQELNVAVAERRGAALRLPPSSAGTAALTRALTTVTNNASFAEGARGVQRLYETVDGAGRAADAMLAHLAQPHRSD